jgi:hypothetical protein
MTQEEYFEKELREGKIVTEFRLFLIKTWGKWCLYGFVYFENSVQDFAINKQQILLMI